MVVATVNYGTTVSHAGTLAEVMGAITGISASAIIAIYYDAGLSKNVAIVRVKA